MGKVFKGAYRVPRERPTGGMGFVNVRKGETPEEHGLAPDGLEALLEDSTGSPKAQPLDRMGEIVKAISELDPDDPDQWTAKGKPRVEDLEDLLGYDITEAERNEAWEIYQKEGDS